MAKSWKHASVVFFCIASIIFLYGCEKGGGSASTALAEVPSEQSNQKPPGTLIIVGNSLMAGCMESLPGTSASYNMTAAHLIAEQGIRVVNLSRGGNSIASADSQRVDGGINFTQGGRHGTAIWIALGANDFIWEISSLQQYRDRYLRVLSRINIIPRQKIFCVTPLAAGFDYDHRSNSEGASYDDYRLVIRNIAEEGHCTLVDTSQWFDAAEIHDEYHLPDKLHLSEEGHRHYAEYMLKSIRGDYSAP